MSTKCVCDGPCGQAVTDKNSWSTFYGAAGRATFALDLTVRAEDDEDMHLCRYCLLDALAKLDDRPKPPMRVDFYPPPACDHAELVRLVKAWRDAHGNHPAWPNEYLSAVDTLWAYARTLP